MHVLIIGGTGFVGAHVVRRLIEDGHRVTLFHRGQTNADLPVTVSHLYGAREALLGFVTTFKQVSPRIVLDMFPYIEQDAVNVVQAFRGIAERLIAISSMDVYRAYGIFLRLDDGVPDVKPFAENAPLRKSLYPYRSMAQKAGDLLYNYEKMLIEKIVMGETDLPATVLRLPQVYGPRDQLHRLFDYFKRMEDGRSFILLDEAKANWRWTRGYVENVADAIALAVINDRATGRIYNVGEEHALTELAWVQKIGEAAGWKGEIRIVPKDLLPKHLDEPYDWRQHLAADTSRIRQELSYQECVDHGQALKRTLEWERGNPRGEFDVNRFNYGAEDDALKRYCRYPN
ncbi:MAG: NAD-dependent epimerase/dehydratase family protein [bacterium]